MERIITFSAPFSGKMRDVLRNRFSARFCTFLKKEAGRILLNGAPATGISRVQAGDTVTARFFEARSQKVTPVPRDLTVLYEDEDLIAVHKPRGMATVMTFGYETNNLLSALYARGEECNFHIVTRLDKDTEGVVLATKSGVLHSMIAAEGLEKTYLAEMEGLLPSPKTVDAPIARGNDVTRVIAPNGRPAVTEFIPISYTKTTTLALAVPKTGRTHQIRLHAAHLGFPLVGDTLYGNGRGAYNGGQHLCCYRLRFPHPVTGEPLTTIGKPPFFWTDSEEELTALLGQKEKI